MPNQEAMTEEVGQLCAKDAHELCRLCWEGMLYEVQDWIRAGKPVVLGGNPKDTPLAIAAGKGFHSLVLLLLDQGQSQACLDAALAAAGAGGNLEVCRLLLARGAGIRNVNADEVVRCGSPDVGDLLVRLGMDVSADNVLARALLAHSMEALAFFRRLRRLKAVRRQGAMALKHFVIHKNERQATLIKRAGADPRLAVPEVYAYLKRDRRRETSAIFEALWHGTYHMLLRMGIGKKDDAHHFLESACHVMDRAKIMLVLRRCGLPLNDRPDGGSTVLEHCLTTIGMGGHRGLGFPRERAERAWDLLQEIVSKGARWVPNDLRNTRSWLRHADRQRCVEIARVLVESGAAPRETVAALFGTPMIRRRLGSDAERIDAIVGRVR